MHLVHSISSLLLLICAGAVLVDAFAPTRTMIQESNANRAYADGRSVLGPVARNGLGYEDVVIGTGRRILPGDSVACYYTGTFRKGAFGKPTVFDSIVPGDGPPLKIVIGKGEVIKGWDLGILGGLEGEIPPMNVGGRRKLVIPSGLAYGANEVGPIPANQDLEFELEVIQAGKESDISLQYRLGGYAVALGVPAILLLIGFTVLGNL